MTCAQNDMSKSATGMVVCSDRDGGVQGQGMWCTMLYKWDVHYTNGMCVIQMGCVLYKWDV